MNSPSPRRDFANPPESTGGLAGHVALFLAAAATIVAYDAAAAWSSLELGFAYRLALIGSCVLYVAFGFFGARRFGFGRALALGAWIGLVDASLGWAVSWWIGPGRIAGTLDVATWAMTAAFVAAVALVFAAAGAGIAVLTQSRPRA